MTEFLSPGYSFSPAKLLDRSLYQDIKYPKNTSLYVIIPFLVIILMILIGIYGMKHNTIKVWDTEMFLTIILVCSCFGALYSQKYDPDVQEQSYKTASFKCVKQGNLSVNILGGESGPKNINDRKAYPYELYFDKYCYLGKMQNGKFTPNDNDTAVIFNKYYTYINKHKLNKKFAKHATFKRSNKYVTSDGRRQWVLSNGKDLMLHLDNDPHVKQSKVIEN